MNFQVATKTLPFYTKYYGIGYPLIKADLIAIQDFAAGVLRIVFKFSRFCMNYVRRVGRFRVSNSHFETPLLLKNSNNLI